MTLQSAMKRKTERERIAQLFEVMAERVGLKCTRDRYEIDGPREISLHLTKDGCTLNVDLDADCKTGCFLGHWFFETGYREGRLFRPDFEPSTWSRPHHKATSMTDHAEDMIARIEGRFLRMVDGTAFVQEEIAA